MPGRACQLLSLSLAGSFGWTLMPVARGDEAVAEKAARAASFRQQVEPLLTKFCATCHSGNEPKGELSLAEVLKRGATDADHQVWQKMSQKLHAGEMPPEDEPQPSADELKNALAWIDAGLAQFDCGRE